MSSGLHKDGDACRCFLASSRVKFYRAFLPVLRLPPSQDYGACVVNNIKLRKFYVTQAMSTKPSKKIAVLFFDGSTSVVGCPDAAPGC